MTSYDQNKDLIALITCRVSDKSQLKGSGLDSQEHRCRQHADRKGYPVEAVFLETMSGGSNLDDRPAIRSLLAHIDVNAETGKQYVVIFDDHKRFARATEMHLQLKRLLSDRGVKVEYLNLQIDNTPEGKFSETIFAAQAQLEREQNARQTRQKSIARLEKGYWVFRAPIGYRYINDSNGGKILVKDEPLASILSEALTGYATSRFQGKVEVKRFLEGQAEFPKCFPNGEIRQWKVDKILNNKIYAGVVESKKWGIPPCSGQHPPLISLATHEQIIQRLRSKKKTAPIRKDISADFPLRGFISCSECGNPLSGGWSKGKYSKYAYYMCWTRSCSRHRKNIPKAKIEKPFEDLLRQLEPTKMLFEIAKAMFQERWNAEEEALIENSRALKLQSDEIEKEINSVLDKIIEASNPRVISRLEQRISDLELKQQVLSEKATQTNKPHIAFEKALQLSLQYLANPWKIWNSGQIELRRIVLNLTFSNRLKYCLESGLTTPQLSAPFHLINQISRFEKSQKNSMNKGVEGNSLLKEASSKKSISYPVDLKSGPFCKMVRPRSTKL